MPQLTAEVAPYFVGRAIRHRETRNPARLIATLAKGSQLIVKPNHHRHEEVVDTSDYDAFISRNNDLRYLFEEIDMQAEAVADAATPEPDAAIVAVPPPIPKAAEHFEPVAHILSSLEKIKSVRAVISAMEEELSSRRAELAMLQKDATALRALLDDAIGVQAVSATKAGRQSPTKKPRAKSLPRADRANAIIDWARSVGGRFTTKQCLEAMANRQEFAGIKRTSLVPTISTMLVQMPEFRKIGHGEYVLAVG